MRRRAGDGFRRRYATRALWGGPWTEVHGYYQSSLRDGRRRKVAGAGWKSTLLGRRRSINLRGGQTYTAAATDYDRFFLSVRKPNGAILAYQSGYSPRVVFRAPVTGRYFVEVKSTQDTYWGTNEVHYIVATGNLPMLPAARQAQASAGAGDDAPRTLEAAKAAAGKEITD